MFSENRVISKKKKAYAEIRRLFPTKKQVISKKKAFAEIRRLFLTEITNLNGFSGQKQQLFSPNKIPWGGKK